MKRIFIILSAVMLSFSSCIDWGLEELPVYEEANILEFNLEYRYVDTNDNGFERLAVVTLPTTTEIDDVNHTVTVDASIPDPSGSFTQEEREKVSLSNLVAYAKISPAAKLQPMNGAPQLGKPGDFTQEREYRVTAADGKTVYTWKVKINLLPAINE